MYCFFKAKMSYSIDRALNQYFRDLCLLMIHDLHSIFDIWLAPYLLVFPQNIFATNIVF